MEVENTHIQNEKSEFAAHAGRKGRCVADGCIIRAMPTTDSDGCRPPVPSDAVQSFRRMASDFSETLEPVVAMIWNQWTARSGIRKGKRTPPGKGYCQLSLSSSSSILLVPR